MGASEASRQPFSPPLRCSAGRSSRRPTPRRRGRGTGFRQTMGTSPECCPLLPCPQLGGPGGPQKLPARLSTPHPVFTAPRAHPGLRQPCPSPPTAEARQEEGLGTGGCRKDPPRRPGPAPAASQGPRAASALPCLSPPCPEPGREPTSTAAASLPGSSRLPHPHARSPRTRRGQASASLAMPLHTERERSPAGTVLALRTVHCAGPQAEPSRLLLGLSRAQGRPEASHHQPPPGTATPRHSHPQTAAVCAGGQSPPAAPVQQALGCPAQIGVCRATPQAVLAATHTLAAHRPPQGSRGWGRTCRSRTGLGASSPRPLPAAPEHPGPDAVLALARGKAARGSPAPDHPAGAQRSQRPEPAEAGCARGTEAARRRGRSVPPVAGAIWSRSCGHCHVCHGDGEPRRAEGRA